MGRRVMSNGVRTKLLISVTPILVVGVAALVGCVGEGQESTRRTTPPFSHKQHVINEEMKCWNCHRTAEKADEASMPTYKTCTKCHEGTDPKKVPNEVQIQGYVKDGNPVWSYVTRLSKEVRFSHKVHVDGKLLCGNCHKGIDNSDLITPQQRITKPECLSCHAKMGVGASAKDNCAMCHKQVSRDLRPTNHTKDWKELHGRTVGFMSRSDPGNCNQCHTQKTCTQCHRSEPPKNHTNHWRERGHGASADLDRSSCKTCHTEDACARCHQMNAPRSHRGNFDSTHCLGCHLPLKDNNCSVCHKATPSHSAAPRPPTNSVHVKANESDCRTCHFGLKMNILTMAIAACSATNGKAGTPARPLCNLLLASDLRLYPMW